MNEEIISLLTKLNDQIETGFKDVNKRIDNLEEIGKTFEKGLIDLKHRAGEISDMNVIERAYFYNLVDNIPDAKLDELERTLRVMGMPELVLTEEEEERLRIAREQVENGETVTFETFEEMEQYFMNDDEDDDDKEA